MSDKLYKCPECGKSDNGQNWDKKTMEFCGTEDITPIEQLEFGTYFFCPSCEKEIYAFVIEEMVVKEKCEYCEGDVDYRKNLIVNNNYPSHIIKIYIDGDGSLTDNTSDKKINYCPMCGRKL